MAIPTQGTQLYFINPLSSGGSEIVEVGCPTAIDGLSMPKENLETTCLGANARTYIPGLATPGTATVTLNFDPSDESHVILSQLWNEDATVQFVIGMADGATPRPDPTLDSTGEEFDLPDTRSWVVFEGFVNDMPLSFALNSTVTSSVAIQVSGAYTVVPRTA